MSEDVQAVSAPAGAAPGLSIAGAPDGPIDPNESVSLAAISTGAGSVTWQTSGVPASGTGPTFTTRFADPGPHDVTASITTGAGEGGAARVTIAVREPSGLPWCRRFPGSAATADLASPFRQNAERFIAALRAAGAHVNIGATLRPPERAYLMHFAWEIARNGANPTAMPRKPGVEIAWSHRDGNGNLDATASKQAAQAMIGPSGFDTVVQAVLESRHTQGRAIDMDISWTGDLAIADGRGNRVAITGAPRDGTNTDLHAVGRSYGVIKLVQDPPHWSDDGH